MKWSLGCCFVEVEEARYDEPIFFVNGSSMRTSSPIPPEWRDWIYTNIQRGCTPQSLIEVLVANQFDPMLAASEVATMQRQLLVAGSSAQQNAYVYETSRIEAGNAIVLGDRTVQVVARLERPEILILADFLSAEECEELIRQSRAKLGPSTVVNPQTGTFDVIADRSSFGTYFTLEENDLISALDRRIAELTGHPLANGEGIQILRYPVGGEYKAHFDYFPPADPGSGLHLAHGGQRVATLVMYLNDVEEGGETYFPNAGGLSVAPRGGSAVYFAYCNSHGQVDRATLHGGAPVRAGEKWIATKWIRQSAHV